jgi:Flp pilus assembly protein TadG
MALAGRIKSVIERFARNQAGTIAIIFALSVAPMLLGAGMAVDYIRYASARTDLQAALDAGALAAAAATNLTDSERVATADKTFTRNIQSAAIADADVTRSFKIVGDTVEASASLNLPVALMQLAGLRKMSVDVESEIEIPGKLKAEIALVLDYSGSMTEVLGGQVKYVAMRNAAKKLVDDLAATNPKNIKVGLVPFSHHVWVTLPKQYVKGQTGPGDWTGCTQDRKYPYNITDDTPTTTVDDSKWGQKIAKVHASDGCGAYVPNHLTVLPLTSDFAAVNSQLDAMVPYAWTHIALGAEFGFHLLSPNAPFSDGASYSDTKTKKFMVLLTDGMQTEPAFGSSSRTVADGESNLSSICTNAKAKGITIITIAYNIDDSDTVSRLRNCTTDPDTNFFDIGSDNNVASAFDAIKKQITAQIRIGK